MRNPPTGLPTELAVFGHHCHSGLSALSMSEFRQRAPTHHEHNCRQSVEGEVSTWNSFSNASIRPPAGCLSLPMTISVFGRSIGKIMSSACACCCAVNTGHLKSGCAQSGHESCAKRALDAYFEGNIDAIDELSTATGGTEFQRQVWVALRANPEWNDGKLRRIGDQTGASCRLARGRTGQWRQPDRDRESLPQGYWGKCVPDRLRWRPGA